MKTVEDSVALAEEMVKIGENAGRRTAALITNMDIPLGNHIGNSLEVIEAVNTLKGQGPKDFTEVCLNLAANMLYLAGAGKLEECMEKAKNAIADGSALKRLAAMVEAQGGDPAYILDTEKFEKAAYSYEVRAKKAGYIVSMNTESCGIASSMLGVGRITIDSEIDYSAGIVIRKKTGEQVAEGDVLATMYSMKQELFEAAAARYLEAVEIGEEQPAKQPLIYARVTKDAVEML